LMDILMLHKNMSLVTITYRIKIKMGTLKVPKIFKLIYRHTAVPEPLARIVITPMLVIINNSSSSAEGFRGAVKPFTA